MRSSDFVAPIIINRKKIINSSTHHGGAWKVAYADFVTAMMAFFMLMWLLNATTEKQRKGLADYFSPTISINRISGGGREMFGGESVLANESLPHQGTGMTSFQTIKSLGIQGISGLQSGAQNSRAEQSRLQRVFYCPRAMLSRNLKYQFPLLLQNVPPRIHHSRAKI